MIHLKEFPKQSFDTRKEAFKALIENKNEIMALKKSTIKHSDGFNFGFVKDINKEEVVKANTPVLDPDLNELTVKVVMNTIGLYDSHGDVHIKNIWKRTLDHSSKKLHLQEHKREFDKVIANDANAYVRTLSWKTLGAEYEGSTQALIFETLVKKSRSPLMFEQYKNGWVNNHSVGMGYVDFKICMNSEESWASEYKDNWEEYYPDVANKEDVDASGYFWAITEAKLIEGSAVLFGSNYITPTLENNMKTVDTPSSDPLKSTQDEQKSFFNNLI